MVKNRSWWSRLVPPRAREVAVAAKAKEAKPARLKVFQAQFGFYDSVVAAASQPAALRAWGTHQNLFADGQARVAEDEAAIAAALAHPDVPLRRAVGSNSPFELEPTSLPRVPDLPKRISPKPGGNKSKPAARPKPPADRSKLEAAERALVELDAARQDEERDLRQRQSDLDTAILAARSDYLKRRKAVKAALVAAREAYRKAGGAD